MTHFEYMESIGQTNIFEFLEAPLSPGRNNAFITGDKVKIRFYTDELPSIEYCHPHLLGRGEIVGKKLDFYIVQIGERTVAVPGDKLILA